jgi:hypothetical protein
MHAAGDRAPQQAPRRIGRLAQQRQFLAELIEQTGKTLYRCAISRTDVCLAAARLHNQIDRAVLQMKPPAIGQTRHLRNPGHARRPGADCSEGV